MADFYFSKPRDVIVYFVQVQKNLLLIEILRKAFTVSSTLSFTSVEQD